MIVAFFSDKMKHRFAFTLMPIFIAISGFGILLTVHNKPHTQYAALFLVAMGSYSAMPVIVCWFNMNLGGHHRRAVGTAWQIGFGTQRLMKHDLNSSTDVQPRKYWWNHRNFVRFHLNRSNNTGRLEKRKEAQRKLEFELITHITTLVPSKVKMLPYIRPATVSAYHLSPSVPSAASSIS